MTTADTVDHDPIHVVFQLKNDPDLVHSHQGFSFSFLTAFDWEI